jgi:hypothetical protein
VPLNCIISKTFVTDNIKLSRDHSQWLPDLCQVVFWFSPFNNHNHFGSERIHKNTYSSYIYIFQFFEGSTVSVALCLQTSTICTHRLPRKVLSRPPKSINVCSVCDETNCGIVRKCPIRDSVDIVDGPNDRREASLKLRMIRHVRMQCRTRESLLEVWLFHQRSNSIDVAYWTKSPEYSGYRERSKTDPVGKFVVRIFLLVRL